ncbi:NIL domain-containing protein [Chloroflexota bacterium]
MKKQVTLAFDSESVAEPIIFALGQQFNIITNIRQAEILEDRGWITLELEGEDKNIEDGLVWAISRGVRVDPVI